MKLLVTGGAGFIGSHFVSLLVKEGHQVTILDALTYAGSQTNLNDIEKGPGSYELVVGNICQTSLVEELLSKNQVHAVVNFAAESHVDRSIDAPATFIETNIRGTFSLLTASYHYWNHLSSSEQKNFRYVQISTDEVFGSLGPEGQFTETTPFSPRSPYSASKAAGDHLVQAWYHTYGLPTLTTHCSNNYGPKQFPEKLIPRMLSCALQGEPLPVYGDGKNVRDWIHVEDHCAGILLALQKGRVGEAYCFGGHAERSNLDLVHVLCRALDQFKPRRDGKPHESHIQFVKDRLGHDRRYAIDDTKAEKELGFRRKHEFEKGLLETVQWYLEKGNL